MPKVNPTPGRPTPQSLAEAQRRRIESYLLTLDRLRDLGAGSSMAPCAAAGSHIGLLVGLETKGFAKRLDERDRIGDLRFEPTEAAFAPDADDELKRMLRSA